VALAVAVALTLAAGLTASIRRYPVARLSAYRELRGGRAAGAAALVGAARMKRQSGPLGPSATRQGRAAGGSLRRAVGG
jgi:hypothetical protein